MAADRACGGYCQSVSRLRKLHHDELGTDGKQVWEQIITSRGNSALDGSGGLAGPFNAFVHAPGVGGHVSELGAAVRFETSIEPRLAEVAIITVAARWRAEFEWWAHARMAREQGVAAEVVDAIGAGDEPPFSADDERTVYAVASQLSRTGQVSQDAYDAARRLLGDAGMVELVTLCGYYTLISYLLNAFAAPLPAGSVPRWERAGRG
jgi:4-carboxymuconolactone decarboxylase